MSMKGFVRNFKPLKLLSDQQVEEIHKSTLELLQRTGLRFDSERALDLFEENECKVDRDTNRVKFPPDLVEECLRKTPSSFYFKARDPKSDLMIGGNTTYFCSFPGMQTVDLETWEPRTATKEENAKAARILDALENLHFLTPYTPYWELEDVPSVMSIPESAANKIRNSTKLQFTGYQKDCEIFTIKMAKIAGTEIQGMCESSAPLTYYEDAVNSAFRFAEADLPLHITSGTVMGGTGPATIAGSLVTSNAEVIGGVVLSQLIKPGTRVVVNDFVFPQNMRSGAPGFGGIGISLHEATFNQVWRSYNIPVQSSAAAPTSSKKIDFQCGYEKAIGCLIAALSGAHIIQLHGGLYGEKTYHPIQSILDDDIAGMIGRFIEGVEVSEETLAIDLINEVGPIPGTYLNKEHTRKWWRKEQFIPKAADRLSYSEWLAKDKKDAIELAKERMEDILETHEPTPLTERQEKEISKTLDEARQYYDEKGLL